MLLKYNTVYYSFWFYRHFRYPHWLYVVVIHSSGVSMISLFSLSGVPTMGLFSLLDVPPMMGLFSLTGVPMMGFI